MTLQEKQARLESLRPLSPEAVRSLQAAWEVTMIYESNSIEGNTLTLRETELVLSKGVTISEKPLKDHLEAVNLAAAWDHLQTLCQPETPFSQSHLLDFHRIILSRIDDQGAGKFRAHPVRISGSEHEPPHHLKVPELIEALFQKLPTLPDPLSQATALHHGIASIHPFADGNGRAARLSMNFVLMAAGYPPVSISPNQRLDYYAALEAADSGQLSTFQTFLETQLHTELDQWLQALEA